MVRIVCNECGKQIEEDGFSIQCAVIRPKTQPSRIMPHPEKVQPSAMLTADLHDSCFKGHATMIKMLYPILEPYMQAPPERPPLPEHA